MHKLAWLHQVGAEYDASTFDTDPFEPEPDGVGHIFPFGFKDATLTDRKSFHVRRKDFSLFVVLRERNIDIRKQQLDWVADNRFRQDLSKCFGGRLE